MWTLAFWKAVAERSISTFLQTLIATITVFGVNAGLEDINWAAVWSVSAVALIVSVAKNVLVGLSKDGDVSLTNVEKVVTPPQ